MVLFLTSSQGGHTFDDPMIATKIDASNGLIKNLKKYWKKKSKALFISAAPSDSHCNDENARIVIESFNLSRLKIKSIDICDDRNPKMSSEFLKQYDFVFLAGGHAPTENAFFKRIGLREAIKEYDGVVLSLSAGSMNCADNVYIMPEIAEDMTPDFVKFTDGLGLTDINMIPHYYYIKDVEVEGKKPFDDCAVKDSFGHLLYVVPDGSYFIIKDGITTLYGETFTLKDGILTKINDNNEVKIINVR